MMVNRISGRGRGVVREGLDGGEGGGGNILLIEEGRGGGGQLE